MPQTITVTSCRSIAFVSGSTLLYAAKRLNIHIMNIRCLFLFCCSLLFCAARAQLKPGTLYTWTGTIGKATNVSFWFAERDSVVVGAITYKRSGKPIALRGFHTQDTEYRLMEFGTDGAITGVLTGTAKGNGFTGEWFSPKTRRSHPLQLKLQQAAVPRKPVVLPAKSVSGTYAYSYSEDGPQGLLSVRQINDSAVIEFNNITAGPAYNQATIEPVTVALQNNGLIYTIQEGCVIRIRFYNDVAVVDYVADASDCLFGMNATVDGIYLKTGK
jgi:hypothetical protein